MISVRGGLSVRYRVKPKPFKEFAVRGEEVLSGVGVQTHFCVKSIYSLCQLRLSKVLCLACEIYFT